MSDIKKLSKKELLAKLDETEKELIEILSDPKISKKKVKVPWNKEPIPPVSCLWSLDSHEILHQGWNLALDHLNIERFPALKKCGAREKWPFEKVAYSGGEIDFEAWEALL